MSKANPIGPESFAPLLAKIRAHPTYGPALESAAHAGSPLALNYHTHGAGGSYCVSICTIGAPIIALIGEPQLKELAHIQGFAANQKRCLAMHPALAEALELRYPALSPPALYVNGKPDTNSTDGAAR